MRSPRRLLALLTICLLGLSLLAAGGYWAYHTTRPEYRFRAGQKALLQGNFAKADQWADRLEASGYPDHAHLLRGQGHLRQRQLNLAVLEYNQISHENEEVLAEASLIYGLGFLSVGRAVEAEKFLLYVASVRPDNVDARRGLATLYFDRGAMNQAITHIVKWSELDPRNGRPERFLGVIYEGMAADTPAVEHYRAALSLELPPRDRKKAGVELAQLLVKRSEFAEALACLDEATDEAEESATTALRAECLYGLGRHGEATKLLDRVLAEDPSSVRALRMRATIQLGASEDAAAVLLLERALRIDAHDYASRYQLALACQRLGRLPEAAEHYRLLEHSQRLWKELAELNQAAIQRPSDADLRRQLADLCERLNKPELAQMWLRAAAGCPTAEGTPAKVQAKDKGANPSP